MAQSEFLKLQDKNGDRLIDECDDQPVVPEQPVCPDCKKDPYATTPNWKMRSDDEPWLNKKICAYQVTITTSYTTSAASSSDSDSAANVYINKRFKEYADTAIESLIVNFNKKLDKRFETIERDLDTLQNRVVCDYVLKEDFLREMQAVHNKLDRILDHLLAQH